MKFIFYVGIHRFNTLKILKLRRKIIAYCRQFLPKEKIVFMARSSLMFLENPVLDQNNILFMFVEQPAFDQYLLISNFFSSNPEIRFPIAMYLNENTATNRQKYYQYGIFHFFQYSVPEIDVVNAVKPTLDMKLKLAQYEYQINEVNLSKSQKDRHLSLLKKYVPSTLWQQVDNLAESQELVIPEYEETIAILSLDLVGFTSRSEKMHSKGVIDLINDCLKIIEKAIYQFNGDIDKFVGDAVIGVFPDVNCAIMAATTIQDKLQEYNHSFVSKIKAILGGKDRSQVLKSMLSGDDDSKIKVRIGIHYGNVIRGKVGGEKRYSNNIIGESLDIADFLQSSSEHCDILVSKKALETVEGLDLSKLDFKQYDFENKRIEASQVYEYVKNNKDFSQNLLKNINGVKNDNSMS